MARLPVGRVVAAAIIGMVASTLNIGGARADCLYAEVFVERENANTIYPLGPNPCLTPTFGTWMVFLGPVDVGHDVPDGAPKRVYVDVRVPVP